MRKFEIQGQLEYDYWKVIEEKIIKGIVEKIFELNIVDNHYTLILLYKTNETLIKLANMNTGTIVETSVKINKNVVPMIKELMKEY